MNYQDAYMNEEELIRLRREIHMHPGLAWDVDETADIVCRELESFGIPYERGLYGRNTVTVTIRDDLSGFTIGLRADMDALPIQEVDRGHA